MHAGQLREFVVRPALQLIGLWSPAAENLVLGTALTESRAEYVRQVGGGPARSLWQIEPATERDLWKWLSGAPGRAELAAKIRQTMWPGPLDNLTGNMPYGAQMCRVFYRRLPDALPAPNDAMAMAQLWKLRYNTHLGAGTVPKALPFFKQACGV